ncbi:Transport-associated protein [Candidatus Sulfopaludibacter sp. SbA3]|nr:Transport-associated protein [Candidatus Sulfopaludibacter sp. SbA3]
MWNDTILQHDVEREICWELSAGLTQISVTVKGGAVELAGHVDSFWEKCAAERAAWRVVHVNHVINGIRVVVPFDRQRGDDDIALAAMGILEWNGLVPETIAVQVADGLVTLAGGVERQQQKEEAERALCTLIGITGIRNDIVIQPAVGLGDIRAPIEAALKRSAVVDSSHIKVHVAHGVVSLRGAAGSRAEYEEAMHAAWSAPGVTKVEDHVTIGSVRNE